MGQGAAGPARAGSPSRRPVTARLFPEGHKWQRASLVTRGGGHWLGSPHFPADRACLTLTRGRSRGLSASGWCVCRRPLLPSDPGTLLHLLGRLSICLLPGSSSCPAPERGPPHGGGASGPAPTPQLRIAPQVTFLGFLFSVGGDTLDSRHCTEFELLFYLHLKNINSFNVFVLNKGMGSCSLMCSSWGPPSHSLRWPWAAPVGFQQGQGKPRAKAPQGRGPWTYRLSPDKQTVPRHTDLPQTHRPSLDRQTCPGHTDPAQTRRPAPDTKTLPGHADPPRTRRTFVDIQTVPGHANLPRTHRPCPDMQTLPGHADPPRTRRPTPDMQTLLGRHVGWALKGHS